MAAVAAYFALRRLPVFRHCPPSAPRTKSEEERRTRRGSRGLRKLSDGRDPDAEARPAERGARALLIAGFVLALRPRLRDRPRRPLQLGADHSAGRWTLKAIELAQRWPGAAADRAALPAGRRRCGRVRVYESMVVGRQGGPRSRRPDRPLPGRHPRRGRGCSARRARSTLILIPWCDPMTSPIGVPRRSAADGAAPAPLRIRRVRRDGETLETHGPDSFIGHALDEHPPGLHRDHLLRARPSTLGAGRVIRELPTHALIGLPDRRPRR